MKVQSLFSGGPGGWHAACGAALLTALFAVVPFRAFADQNPSGPAACRRETLAGALAQTNAIAAARKTRVAQRGVPPA